MEITVCEVPAAAISAAPREEIIELADFAPPDAIVLPPDVLIVPGGAIALKLGKAIADSQKGNRTK